MSDPRSVVLGAVLSVLAICWSPSAYALHDLVIEDATVKATEADSGPLLLAFEQRGNREGESGPGERQRQASTDVPAAESPKDRLSRVRINIRGHQIPLGSILNQIARSASLALVVDKDVRLDVAVPTVDMDGVTLDAALAVLLTPMGYSYEVDEERSFLRVYVYANRTFRVAMPVVVQQWDASISNMGGTQQSGGSLGASISLSTRSETDGLWEEVERSLAQLLGMDREKNARQDREDAAPVQELGWYSINRVAGFATVRALPSVMPAIESYFITLNSEMSRAVAIEVRVMQVEITDEKAMGVDWSTATAALGNLYTSAGSVLTPFVPNPAVSAEPGAPGAPFIRFSGLAGDALVRALEQQGDVRVLAQPTLALGNNLPSIIELAEVRAYVNQLTTTVVQGAPFAQTSVQTATLADGLIISIMPRVLENGDVSLALALILQDVLSITPFAFDGGAVQLPHTARRSYSGVVRSRVGETLVIGGLISSRQETRTSGIPFLSKLPFVGFVFGTVQEYERKSEMVITLTPRVIQTVTPREYQTVERRVPTPTRREAW